MKKQELMKVMFDENALRKKLKELYGENASVKVVKIGPDGIDPADAQRWIEEQLRINGCYLIDLVNGIAPEYKFTDAGRRKTINIDANLKGMTFPSLSGSYREHAQRILDTIINLANGSDRRSRGEVFKLIYSDIPYLIEETVASKRPLLYIMTSYFMSILSSFICVDFTIDHAKRGGNPFADDVPPL